MEFTKTKQICSGFQGEFELLRDKQKLPVFKVVQFDFFRTGLTYFNNL